MGVATSSHSISAVLAAQNKAFSRTEILSFGAQILPGVGLFLREPPDGGTAILLAGTGEAA